MKKLCFTIAGLFGIVLLLMAQSAVFPPAGGGGGTWGSITGTLSNQSDLNTALAGKLAKSSNLSDLANAATARTNLGVPTTNLGACASLPGSGSVTGDRYKCNGDGERYEFIWDGSAWKPLMALIGSAGNPPMVSRGSGSISRRELRL